MIERQYPIGPIILKEDYSSSDLNALIEIIENAPMKYRRLVTNLSDEDLAKRYREGSWNIRQLVHHVSDIALLHYFRMKKALTEPDYKATLIDMNAWSETEDSLTAPIEPSLRLFEAVHIRYVHLARTLDDNQMAISYYHPGRQIWTSQKQALAISAWHVEHHLEHIRLAINQQ
jgi:hypothetical protein